uniref:Ion_trans_2 domain-containing protein n=1 Tax=Syphacia muris TaxID=451379 RepID=A0A0N5AM81_9BILA
MTVIYAILGIPLMLITLNDLGKFLYKAINHFVNFSKKKILPLGLFWKHHDKNADIDKVEKGEGSQKEKVMFQLSVDGNTDDELSDDLAQELVTEEKSNIPRVPVPVALFITIGWIFACAGLFKAWESDWTYAESCYFMFISLSTIGLGDVAVKRRDLMVFCFVFVIIGLSLVSMCISVIQSALEDLYMKILIKMIVEYQNKLVQGDSPTGASMGMMQIWNGQKTAKYLMPLLSKEKRKTAMAKVHDVAEAKGMEIPKALTELNTKTGLPNIFAYSEDKEVLKEEIKHIEDEAEYEQKRSFSSCAVPNVVMYDTDTQTDNPNMEDKCEETVTITTCDANVGNESDLNEYECTAVQCEQVSIREESSQTSTVTTTNNDTMTEAVAYTQSTVQTDCSVARDQEIQTHLVDYVEQDAQTEQPFKYPKIAVAHTAIQTDKKPKTSARSRERNSFHSMSAPARRKSASASFSSWRDSVVEEEEEEDEDLSESAESLDWDPRDGLHAEKQRSVRDLKKFWDVKTEDSSSGPKRRTQ